MVDIVVAEVPNVHNLRLSRSDTERGTPTRYDFLASFPKLRFLSLGGDALAWDSLQYLADNPISIDLYKCPLSAAELATNLALINHQSKVKIKLHSCTYDQRQRAVLTVSMHKSLSRHMLTFVAQQICASRQLMQLTFID